MIAYMQFEKLNTLYNVFNICVDNLYSQMQSWENTDKMLM